MYIYEVYWTEVSHKPAGWFSSEDKAMKAIRWLRGVTPKGDFFIRTRELDVINGRYAYTELGIEDPKADQIVNIHIDFEDPIEKRYKFAKYCKSIMDQTGFSIEEMAKMLNTDKEQFSNMLDLLCNKIIEKEINL